MSRCLVLIVAGERSARTALAELLADEGYEIATARDDLEATGKALALHPRVVLCDLAGNIDGLGLRDALEQLADPPAMIFMSAAPPPSAAGRTPTLPKPIAIAALFDAVSAAARCPAVAVTHPTH